MNEVLKVWLKQPVLLKILALCLRAAFAIRFTSRTSYSNDLVVSSASVFPDDVGDLGQRAGNWYGWVLKRDKTYLDWRFVHNPDEYKIWLAAKHGKTVGYLVTKLGKFGRLNVGYLADFLVDENHPEVFEKLCFSAASALSNAGVDLLASWTVLGSFYQKTLSKLGFLRYKPVPIICLKNDLGMEVMQDQSKWHFTMADSDNI